jgi:peptidoglycan/xylan/chitin deacetylase (PgdA/CDA1 family)
MHRSPLGALTAALALLVAALGVPGGSAHVTAVRTVALAASTKASPAVVAVPVQVAKASAACRAGLVALTFDDGPSSSVTAGLVRTLVSLDVPATFFMVGSRIRTAPRTAQLVEDSGFTIGNHTWDHKMLTLLSRQDQLHELRSTAREMRLHGLTPSNLMRPPYGAVDNRVRRVARSMHLVPVLWTIDSRDWAGGTPRQIAHRVISVLRPHGTNLVLQHDGVTNSPSSAEAVPMIVRAARKKGYCFTNLGADGGPATPVPSLRTTVLSGSEDGPTSIRIRLDLDKVTTRPVSVRVHTSAGTATPGKDYTDVAMVIRFPRGVRTAWFSVPVLDDKKVEPVEDVEVNLDQPKGLVVDRAKFAASIFSDD